VSSSSAPICGQFLEETPHVTGRRRRALSLPLLHFRDLRRKNVAIHEKWKRSSADKTRSEPMRGHYYDLYSTGAAGGSHRHAEVQ